MDTSNEQKLLLPKEENESQTSPTLQLHNPMEIVKNISKQLFPKKKNNKRKRTNYNNDNDDNDEIIINPISEIFLKIFYPLTISMDKSIVVGVFKSLDFAPGILLLHNGKSVLFSEDGWNSFNKNMNLVQCYLINKVYGKKTSIRLTDSNIEIENVKIRSAQGVRFRDLTKYDSKIVLNDNEFSNMIGVTPAVNRYLDQLSFCGPVIRDYLTETTSKQPNMHLIYGPIDTSIYNRLPQEVELYRSQLTYKMHDSNENGKEENYCDGEVLKNEKREEEEEEEKKDNAAGTSGT